MCTVVLPPGGYPIAVKKIYLQIKIQWKWREETSERANQNSKFERQDDRFKQVDRSTSTSLAISVMVTA